MDREKPAKTKRLPVTLSLATHDYLANLALKGTHGTSVTDVAKTLIEEGIRQAIQNGFLDRKIGVSPNRQSDNEQLPDASREPSRSEVRSG
jgi:hypothetical protein